MLRPLLSTVFQAFLWIGLCLGVGVISALSTRNAGTEYQALKKPALSPPGWLFGPVWTVLYTMMGVAAFLVWRRVGLNRTGRKAFGLFSLQLLLNALWSPIFFGLRRYGAAVLVIVALWIAILATILVFLPIAIAAAVLLLPYLLWVGFAAYLNISIWRRN